MGRVGGRAVVDVRYHDRQPPRGQLRAWDPGRACCLRARTPGGPGARVWQPPAWGAGGAAAAPVAREHRGSIAGARGGVTGRRTRGGTLHPRGLSSGTQCSRCQNSFKV